MEMVQVAGVQVVVELGPSMVTVCPQSSSKQLPGVGQAASSWAMKLVGVFSTWRQGQMWMVVVVPNAEGSREHLQSLVPAIPCLVSIYLGWEEWLWM